MSGQGSSGRGDDLEDPRARESADPREGVHGQAGYGAGRIEPDAPPEGQASPQDPDQAEDEPANPGGG